MTRFQLPFHDLLFTREYTPSINLKSLIEDGLEDSFLLHPENVQKIDLLLPPDVSSTIAIDISPDSSTFASTHGDHTVKVFLSHSLEQIRNFQGHPRTPWTVKYHPTNPDLLASGCLGFNVCVWSIKENRCIRSIVLDACIISLSFHPSGQYIAVSSGSNVEIWKWWSDKEGGDPSSTTTPVRVFPTVNNVVAIHHNRNIRAVFFHPSGQHLLVACPCGSRQQNDSKSFPIILPQVHLYSDGGLDISPDGDYLVTCSALPEEQVVSRSSSSTSSGNRSEEATGPLSPLSISQQIEESPLLPRLALPVGVHGSPSLACPPSLPSSSLSAAAAQEKGKQQTTFAFPKWSSKSSAGEDEDSLAARTEVMMNITSPTMTRNSPFRIICYERMLAAQARCRSSEPPRLTAAIPIPTAGGGSGGAAGTSQSAGRPSSSSPKKKNCVALFRLTLSHQGKGLRADTVSTMFLPGKLVGAVTSVKLSPTGRYVLLGYGVRGEHGIVIDHVDPLVACEVLAITPKKKDDDNNTPNTPVIPSSMSRVFVLTNDIDEVNIVQFNNLPGSGIVYGTKKGNMRCFRRIVT
eukprot:scaffold686_cov177-Ochromonas_danica.AAC.9